MGTVRGRFAFPGRVAPGRRALMQIPALRKCVGLRSTSLTDEFSLAAWFALCEGAKLACSIGRRLARIPEGQREGQRQRYKDMHGADGSRRRWRSPQGRAAAGDLLD